MSVSYVHRQSSLFINVTKHLYDIIADVAVSISFHRPPGVAVAAFNEKCTGQNTCQSSLSIQETIVQPAMQASS